MKCRLHCGRDTTRHGYTYGVCDPCVKALIEAQVRDLEAYERLYQKGVNRESNPETD